jgi:hypothetical protein
MGHRARRAARKVGLVAKKSGRSRSIDNAGDFMLVDPEFNGVVRGSRFDMTAEDVIAFCANYSPPTK